MLEQIARAMQISSAHLKREVWSDSYGWVGSQVGTKERAGLPIPARGSRKGYPG